MGDKTKERAGVLTDVIFRLFGGLYEGVMKGLAKSAPNEIRAAFVILIEEARKRSGLPKEKTLMLIKTLRDVLDHIIANEK